MSMNDLPDELLCAIFSHLRRRWLSLASMACQRWRECALSVVDIHYRHRPWSDLQGLVIPKDTIDKAAAYGLTSLVLWLRIRMGHMWTTKTLHAAVEHGHLHLVDCMLTERVLIPPCPMDESIAAAAVIAARYKGGSRMLRKVRAYGCPWNPSAVAVAITLDNHQALRILADGGCSYDAMAVIAAVALGRRHILETFGFRLDDIAEAKATIRDARGKCHTCFVHCLHCEACLFANGEFDGYRLAKHLLGDGRLISVDRYGRTLLVFCLIILFLFDAAVTKTYNQWCGDGWRQASLDTESQFYASAQSDVNFGRYRALIDGGRHRSPNNRLPRRIGRLWQPLGPVATMGLVPFPCDDLSGTIGLPHRPLLALRHRSCAVSIDPWSAMQNFFFLWCLLPARGMMGVHAAKEKIQRNMSPDSARYVLS
jgi:hypothetical protein